MEEKTLPERLIKYYKCDKNSTDALINNYLWASYPLQFNDPFDCSEKFWDVNSFSMEQIEKNIFDKKSRREFSDKKSNFGRRRLFIEKYAPGVICLNECNYDYENLFWGYYTNQEGFCIFFNTSKLLNAWDRFYPRNFFWQKVEYTDFDNFEKGNLSNVIPDFQRWTKYKKKLWMNENEWRCVFNYEDCNNFHPIFNEGEIIFRQKRYSECAIDRVVLGYKFFVDQANNNRRKELSKTNVEFEFDSEDNQYRWSLLSYIYKKGIELYQVELSEEFELRKRKIEILEKSKTKVLIYYSDIFKK